MSPLESQDINIVLSICMNSLTKSTIMLSTSICSISYSLHFVLVLDIHFYHKN